ncbi:MAG: prepilin-type N-terminal cleavage/methylation domain-containing protein [Candidatus Omnitrophota bacterium]|nr:prepilin-type N-terminal cleavage/methylation domain-containing protein [Candidatus Omnitrophota bacterium]
MIANGKNRGFTLVELIVAMVIIAITAVGAFEFYVFSMKNFIMKARLTLMATDFATDKMEKLYYLALGDLPPEGDTTNDQFRNDTYLTELKNRGGNCLINVTSTTNYKIVTTKITWN